MPSLAHGHRRILRDRLLPTYRPHPPPATSRGLSTDFRHGLLGVGRTHLRRSYPSSKAMFEHTMVEFLILAEQ